MPTAKESETRTGDLDRVTRTDVLLFLPAWGAGAGLFVALLEKAALFHTASEISAEIHLLLFAVLTGAGLAAGLAAAVVCTPLLWLTGRPRAVLAVAACVILGLGAQVLATWHPEFFGHESPSFIGAGLLRKGLVGAAAAGLSAAVVLRSAGTFAPLFMAASAVLCGIAATRFFPAESVFNALSLPLLALFGSALALRAVPRRLRTWAAAAASLLMPVAFFFYSAHSGTTAAAALVKRAPGKTANAALVGARPNVVIVVLDTLRPDHTSAMGYPRQTTPNLDRFLEGATLYRRAKSVSSWTLPAHASLFTGLWPRSHGARYTQEKLAADSGADVAAIAYPLRSDIPTFAEAMANQGYITAGIVSNYVWLCSHFGLDRGFDYYFCAPRYRQAKIGRLEPIPVSLILDDLLIFTDRRRMGNYSLRQSYYRAPEITTRAVDWLAANRREKFFLFLNYWDPHSPYNPPSPYDEMFPGRSGPRGRKLDWIRGNGDVMRGREDIEGWRQRELVSQYDGEIAYMDFWLGRLFDGMRELGLYEDSLIVLLSDHGESFGEHRYLEHGASVYEHEAAMLLAVKEPGQAAAASDRFVQTHDIMPTVLEDLRIMTTRAMEGEHLEKVAHPIVSELYPPIGRVDAYGERFDRTLTALYRWDMKVIRSSAGDVEVYDLAADPGELRDLAEAPAAREALLAALGAWETTHPVAVPSEFAAPDAALMEKMKSLGYLQ